MSNTQSYCPHTRQALVTLDSAEGSCPGEQPTCGGGEPLESRLVHFGSQGFQV